MDIYKFDDYGDVLCIDEVKKLLRTSRASVYRLIKSGDLTAIRIGNNYRVAKVNVIKLLYQDKKSREDIS